MSVVRNIRNSARLGTDGKSYLAPSGKTASTTGVTMNSRDDASGRQRWIMTPTGTGSKILVVSGGREGPSTLSAVESGGSLRLEAGDDKSGRQRWTFRKIGNYYEISVEAGKGLKVPSENVLTLAGGGSDALLLKKAEPENTNSRRFQLWSIEDPNAPTTAAPTLAPTPAPTFAPTSAPTFAPTFAPTIAPTSTPTFAPTFAPTSSPYDATAAPESSQSPSPTLAPTIGTSQTFAPTFSPTPLYSETQIPYTYAPTTSPVGTFPPDVTPTPLSVLDITVAPTETPAPTCVQKTYATSSLVSTAPTPQKCARPPTAFEKSVCESAKGTLSQKEIYDQTFAFCNFPNGKQCLVEDIASGWCTNPIFDPPKSSSVVDPSFMNSSSGPNSVTLTKDGQDVSSSFFGTTEGFAAPPDFRSPQPQKSDAAAWAALGVIAVVAVVAWFKLKPPTNSY